MPTMVNLRIAHLLVTKRKSDYYWEGGQPNVYYNMWHITVWSIIWSDHCKNQKKTPEMLPGFNSRDKTSSVSTRRFTRLGDVLKLGAQLANTDSLNRWINGVAGGRNLL